MEWFIVGSMPFWILTLVVLGVIIAAVEKESGAFASVCFLVYAVAIQFASDFNLVDWIKAHYLILLVLVLGYFIAGTVWGVFKWGFYTRKKAAEADDGYRTLRLQFLTMKNVHNANLDTKIPDHLKEEWAKYVGNGRNGNVIAPLQVRDHKSQIMMWMTFWPASLTWTFINDPVRALFLHIYSHLSKTLQNISNQAFNEATSLEYDDKPLPNGPPSSTAPKT